MAHIPDAKPAMRMMAGFSQRAQSASALSLLSKSAGTYRRSKLLVNVEMDGVKRTYSLAAAERGADGECRKIAAPVLEISISKHASAVSGLDRARRVAVHPAPVGTLGNAGTNADDAFGIVKDGHRLSGGSLARNG